MSESKTNEEVESKPKTLTFNGQELTIKIVPSRRKSVKKARIDLTGKATIGNAKLVKSSFDAALNSYDILDLHLTEASEIDFSLYQLFVLTKRGAAGQSKTFNIHLGEIPSSLDLVYAHSSIQATLQNQ